MFKKLILFTFLLALVLPGVAQDNEYKFYLSNSLRAKAGTGFLNQNGTVPLTADWNVGPFSLTAKNLTAAPTLGAELVDQFASWDVAGNWTYGSSKWSHSTGSSVSLVATISAVPNFSPVAGVTYKIVITNTTSTASTGFYVMLGDTYTEKITASGTNTYYLTAASTATLTIITASLWVGSINSISVTVVTNAIVTSGDTTLEPRGIFVPPGNEKSPSIAGKFDWNTGIYWDAGGILSDYLSFTTNGTTKLILNQYGVIVAAGGLYWGANLDLVLNRSAAAVLQLGTNMASPINQTIRGSDTISNDSSGGMLIFQGGVNKGSGAGGGVMIQTADVGASASTAGVEYTRYRAVGKIITLTDASATNVISFAVPANTTVGGMLVYTIKVQDNDASDFQVESGTVIFCGLQDQDSWHTNISEVSTQALESGALATTWAIDTATANTLKITCLADSDLTTPVITLRYQLFLNSPIVETP